MAESAFDVTGLFPTPESTLSPYLFTALMCLSYQAEEARTECTALLWTAAQTEKSKSHGFSSTEHDCPQLEHNFQAITR